MAPTVASRWSRQLRTASPRRSGAAAKLADADVLAEFIPGSVEVRDTDQDDLGEVLLAYRLACRSDVSPAEQKLLVLEDGRKHILRGMTSTPYDPYREPTPELGAADWPDGTFNCAQDRFRELVPEFAPQPSES